MKTTKAVVRDALARHADLDVSTIEDWSHLELDLYLTPRDLVGIVREIADVEDILLPAPDPSTIATVAELVRFVARSIPRRGRDHVSSAAWALRCW